MSALSGFSQAATGSRNGSLRPSSQRQHPVALVAVCEKFGRFLYLYSNRRLPWLGK